MSLGELPEAKSCLDQALLLEPKITSPESTWVRAQSLNNLATLHTEQGHYAEAENLLS